MMDVCVFCFAVWADGATSSLNLNLDFQLCIIFVCFLAVNRPGCSIEVRVLPATLVYHIKNVPNTHYDRTQVV